MSRHNRPGRLSLTGDSHTVDFLSHEREDGNVEFKWKLTGCTENRVEHLATQMQFRLSEGHGECFYELGVADDGTARGLCDQDVEETIATLRMCADALDNVTVEMTSTRNGISGGTCVELRCRQEANPRLHEVEDVRVCVAGAVGAGKSTLIGVLTRGIMDDGFGRVRLQILRHPHEVVQGRTSSASTHLLGFDARGIPLTAPESPEPTPTTEPQWPDICARSSRLVTFTDLAGDRRYLKTTIAGLASAPQPDLALCVVAADQGIRRMTREHLALALALGLRVALVVSKCDLADGSRAKAVKRTMKQMKRLLKAAHRVPIEVRNATTARHCAALMTDAVPIFTLSSVSGVGLPLIRQFLAVVQPTRPTPAPSSSECANFRVADRFDVTNVGTVVTGTLLSGRISTADSDDSGVLRLGPDQRGRFKRVRIKSIHCRKQTTHHVVAGQACSFALRNISTNQIRKGMLLTTDPDARSTWSFNAVVKLISHPTRVRVGFQPVLHIGSIRQAARIESISTSDTDDNDGEALMISGDEATIGFRLCHRPECLSPDQRFVFCDNQALGVGRITHIFHDDGAKHHEEGNTQTQITFSPPTTSSDQAVGASAVDVENFALESSDVEDDTAADEEDEHETCHWMERTFVF